MKVLRFAFLFPGVCQSALTDYIIRAKRNTQVYLKAEPVHIYYWADKKANSLWELNLDEGRNPGGQRKGGGGFQKASVEPMWYGARVFIASWGARVRWYSLQPTPHCFRRGHPPSTQPQRTVPSCKDKLGVSLSYLLLPYARKFSLLNLGSGWKGKKLCSSIHNQPTHEFKSWINLIYVLQKSFQLRISYKVWWCLQIPDRKKIPPVQTLLRPAFIKFCCA